MKQLPVTRLMAMLMTLPLTMGPCLGCGGLFGSGSNRATDQEVPSMLVVVKEMPLLRLSRSQYQHAVEDLLGVQMELETLPGDDLIGHFPHGRTFSEASLALYTEAALSVANRFLEQWPDTLPCDEPLTSACLQSWIPTLLAQAYRRPPTDEELSNAAAIAQTISDQDGPLEALHTLVAGSLVSPRFLHQLDTHHPDLDGDGVVKLDGYSVASRLAFMLWDRPPDAATYEAAAQGRFDTVEGLDAEVRRMLDDPRGRGRDGLASFFLRWIDAERLDTIEKSRENFPLFNEQVRSSMKESLARFFDDLVWNEGTQQDLLSSNTVFVDAALAPIVGISAPPGGEMQRVTSLPTSERHGLLTQPGMLAMVSAIESRSVIRAGSFMLEQIICTKLPPTPADIVDPDTSSLGDNPSPRQVSEFRMATPACGSCHQFIDPAGYPFLAYTPDGRYAPEDAHGTVDTSGSLTGAADVAGDFPNLPAMAAHLAPSPTVSACLFEHAIRFAIGRSPERDDDVLVQTLAESFQERGMKLRDLVPALVRTDAFRFARLPSSPTPSEQTPSDQGETL